MNYPTKSMEELVEIFFKAIKEGDDDTASEIILSLKFYEIRCFNKLYVDIVKLHEKPKHLYMITYTLKEKIPEKLEQIYEDDIILDLKRPSLKGTQCYLAKEYTKKGVVHWHAAIETIKYFKKELFNFWSKENGFVDISKSKHNNIMEILQYISKESKPIKIY